jgi:hypothetical protein
MNGENQLFITRNLKNSNIIIFFLTKKFEKTEQFKEEWSQRAQKAFIVILLEEIYWNSSLDLSQYFVSNLYEALSFEAKEEIIQKNKTFITRLIMLTKFNSNKKHEMILNKFSSNVYGNNSERLFVRKIELINDEEVVVKTSTRENIEKLMIMNYAKATIVSIIANEDIQKQEFCWIKHLNQIFCYQKKKSKLIKEANCSLFSKSGNLIRSVYLIDNGIYEIYSIFYNRNNLQVYLNVLNKSIFKRSILALNEEFNLIKIIDEDLFNSDYPLNYSSEIKFFHIDYKIFHYNSNIAFLQSKYKNRMVYIFDKLSYSIVDSFQSDKILILVSRDKMLFRSKSCYIIQNVPLSVKPQKFLDCDAFCKLNPFKKPHLLSNPYLLPCGNSACLECINQKYNLFQRLLKCQICNQEHIPKQMETANLSTISGIYSQNLIHMMIINENKTFISDLGIF